VSVERVVVLGMSGAGKSTVATAVGRGLDLPVYHLDAIQWKPGWVARDPEELVTAVRALAAGDRWVIDGNYSSAAFDERLERADAVVVLQVSRKVALWRVLGRFWRHRGRTRPDLGEGKPEKLDWDFVRWIWDWERTHPRFIENVRQRAGAKPVLVAQGARDAAWIVDQLRRALP
jgi:adenylate kinase family enzyme